MTFSCYLTCCCYFQPLVCCCWYLPHHYFFSSTWRIKTGNINLSPTNVINFVAIFIISGVSTDGMHLPLATKTLMMCVTYTPLDLTMLFAAAFDHCYRSYSQKTCFLTKNGGNRKFYAQCVLSNYCISWSISSLVMTDTDLERSRNDFLITTEALFILK